MKAWRDRWLAADFPIPRTGRRSRREIPWQDLAAAGTDQRKADNGAVEFLIETFRDTTDEITLVPVAPLTNIAAALTLYPKLAERFRRW